MSNEINHELNTFLESIARDYRVTARQPGDFSIAEFSAKTGLSIPQCNKILNDLTAQGKLIKIRGMSENARRINLYRKPS